MKVACTVLEGESGGNPADLLRIIEYPRLLKYLTFDKVKKRKKICLDIQFFLTFVVKRKD